MGARIEYTEGQLINGLEFREEIRFEKYRTAWFLCKCGNMFPCRISHITSMATVSCGCHRRAATILASTKHGEANKNYLYRLWKDIKTRCYNPNYKQYKDWGGRGIIVYWEWLHDYLSFKNYILTNLGERPKGLTLDRINNDGNYVPGNLRWATRKQQTNNQRKKTKRNGLVNNNI